MVNDPSEVLTWISFRSGLVRPDSDIISWAVLRRSYSCQSSLLTMMLKIPSLGELHDFTGVRYVRSLNTSSAHAWRSAATCAAWISAGVIGATAGLPAAQPVSASARPATRTGFLRIFQVPSDDEHSKPEGNSADGPEDPQKYRETTFCSERYRAEADSHSCLAEC